jgi:hypothetical protein
LVESHVDMLRDFGQGHARGGIDMWFEEGRLALRHCQEGPWDRCRPGAFRLAR